MVSEKEQKTIYIQQPHLNASLLSFLTIIFLFIFSNLIAQSTVNVTVTNANSGEPLIGANIYTEDFSFTTTTDVDGKAVLTDLGYRDEVIVSYIGFSDLKIPIYVIRRELGRIKLFPNAIVDTIVVVGRRDDPVEDIPYEVQRIKNADIAFSNAQTSADALASSAGVFVQKTQAGGGSPIIRGFEANRVLLVVDGVRLNNAIYRNGHLQNAITVDNAMLEQMEVIYGPGSLMYGSDALGGVVHFRTKDPKLLQPTDKREQVVSSNFYTRFASANLEKAGHLDVNYGKKKWGFLSSISLVDYDALRAGSNRPKDYPDFGKRLFYPGQEIRESSPRPEDAIFSNTEDGRDPNIQIALDESTSGLYRWWNTEYSQIDFLQKVKIQPREDVSLVVNYQVSTTSNVPRYDNMLDTISQASELKWSEWYYGPQFRTMVSSKLRLLTKNSLFDKGTFIAAYQRIHEDRLKRKFRNSLRTVNKERVFIYTLTGDFDKKFGADERGLLSYGFDIASNSVQSKAYNFNTRTEKIFLNADTRYPSDGSRMRAYGAYANYTWRTQDRTLVLNGGLRYSSVLLKGRYLTSDRIQWPQDYYSGIENKNQDWTWAAGLTWNPESKFQLRALIAKAFRSPNIDDWAKIRTKANKVTIPNIDLKPEKAINYELTLAQEFGDYNRSTQQGTSFKISATGFASQLRDAIIRVDSSTLVEETLLVDNTPYDIQTNINAENAQIYGFSGNIDFNINNRFLVYSSINFTKGTTTFSNEVVQDTIVPFAHIPPTYGKTGLIFQNNKFKLELNTRYNSAKKIEDYAISDIEVDGSIDRKGTADNFELTPTITNAIGRKEHVGAYGWATFNVYSSFKLNQHLKLNLAMENIFDFHYRPFASTISAPGWNMVIALHGNF